MRGKADRIVFLLEGRASLSALHVFQGTEHLGSNGDVQKGIHGLRNFLKNMSWMW